MAKSVKPFRLSPMTGGVNRYEQEAASNQANEALDVVNEDGDLRRRDAFSAFAMAAPHMLPAGVTHMKYYQYSSEFWGTFTIRQMGSASRQSFGTNTSGKLRLFIGCENPFQGFRWAQFYNGDNSDTVPHYLRIRFVTSDWVDSTSPSSDTGLYESALYVGDTTRGSDGDLFTNADRSQPLSRDGYVWWHKNSTPAAWDTARTVDGVTAYWIVVDMFTTPINKDAGSAYVSSTLPSEYVSEWPSTSVNFELRAPGVMCFNLHPVTGLFSFHNWLDSQLLISSVNPSPRGQETGGPQLGVLNGRNRPTGYVDILKDEGTGFAGTFDTSGWTDNGWTGGSVGPGTDRLTKSDITYDWRPHGLTGGVLTYMGSWGYPILATGVVPGAATTPTTTEFSIDAATLNGSFETEFEDCAIICLDPGLTSIGAGTLNRIIKSELISGGSATITFLRPWAEAPTAACEFIIFGIGHMCTLSTQDWHGGNENDDQFVGPARYEIGYHDSDAHTVYITANATSGVSLGDRYDVANYSGNDGPVNFYIGKEARYELPPGDYPSYTFDEVTREYIFAFNQYPLSKFDGKFMRPLTALHNSNDLVVQQWVGFITEQTAGDVSDPSFERAATLRTEPPRGRFVVYFANRLFVAGLSGDPFRIVFSAPGAFNDIWPKGYETMVRDPSGSAITGLATLNDELVAFTANSIFAAIPPDDNGYVTMQGRSQGIGFINHNVVGKVVAKGSEILLGANADGIYAYTGAEPSILLDEWDRLLDGGVNTAAMYRACATVSLYDNCYYLAVPSRSATYPDRLIRYCWTDQTFYVWTAPFGGITAMNTIRDDAGNETVVFGHEDGTVSTLQPNITDDGETITGYARTALFQSGSTTSRVMGYMVTMEDTGGEGDLTFRQYLDQDDSATTDVYTGDFDGGTAEINSLTVDTDTIGSRKKVTKKLHAKSGTRAEAVQVEIRGTKRWRLRNIDLLVRGLAQRSK